MLSDRIGRRPVLVVGMLLQGIGLAWIANSAAVGSGYAGFVMPLIIAGIGISMALPVVSTAILSAVAARDMGKASGVNSTLQRFGSAFAIAIAAAVFTANGHLGTPASFTAGFRPALGVVAGLSVLGAVSALAVAGRQRAAVAVEPLLAEAASA
jgi:MFS family permease